MNLQQGDVDTLFDIPRRRVVAGLDGAIAFRQLTDAEDISSILHTIGNKRTSTVPQRVTNVLVGEVGCLLQDPAHENERYRVRMNGVLVTPGVFVDY